MQRIGVESLAVIVLTGSFSGMVLALQSYIGFQRVGGENFIGSVVALGMIRELGPVMTGLMVTGRAGSAIAAELGTMRITEQIDALRTLCIDSLQYLVVPRIVAATIILPFLTLFSMLFGILGGYFIVTYVLGLSPEDYINSIKAYVELSDIRGGLIKAGVFGLILSWVGTYKGFFTWGGARGVGVDHTKRGYRIYYDSYYRLLPNQAIRALIKKFRQKERSVIKLINLKKRFGDKWVTRGVNLDIPKIK